MVKFEFDIYNFILFDEWKMCKLYNAFTACKHIVIQCDKSILTMEWPLTINQSNFNIYVSVLKILLKNELSRTN